jgi:hypothetical protein
MTTRFMGMHRWLVLGAMWMGLLMPRVGHSEGGITPLAELRVAAEALADVDPDLVLPPQRSRQIPPVIHDSTAAAATHGTADSRQDNSHKESFRSEIKEAIHGAVRAEIAREAMGRPVLAQQRDRSKGSASRTIPSIPVEVKRVPPAKRLCKRSRLIETKRSVRPRRRARERV